MDSGFGGKWVGGCGGPPMGGDAWVPAAPGGRVQGQERGRSARPGTCFGARATRREYGGEWGGRSAAQNEHGQTALVQEKGYIEMQNEHGQTALVQEKGYIEIATLLEEAEEASLKRTAVRPLKGGPPFRDFLGRLDSWANSRNKACTYKVGGNVLGCVRVHVCVACRPSGMWGEEWCGAWGVRRERARCESGERGGVVAGWAAVPELVWCAWEEGEWERGGRGTQHF